MKTTIFMMVVVCLAAALNSFGQAMVDIKITPGSERFPADTGVELMVTMINNGNEPIKMLTRETPLNGLEEDILSLSLDGRPVEYMGPHYKWAEPAEEDYVTLQPGESLSGIIDLWGAYDIRESGRYAVSFKPHGHDEEEGGPRGAKEGSAVNFISDPIYIDIEGRPFPEFPDEEEVPGIVNNGTSFTRCTTGEQSQLRQAREHALNIADDSLDYLASGRQDERFTRWFGKYDKERYDRATLNFREIRDAVDFANVRFKCNCNKERAFAFVYPWSPFNIHICPVFWRAPMTGRNSKAGTIIHEMSHFWTIASTRDIEYGVTASLNLAADRPHKAIKNADNHEYFAEDTPYDPYDPCGPLVTMFDGTQRRASWDGANCNVMPIPPGATPVINNNRFMTRTMPGRSCPPPSSFDGMNCYILSYPPWNTNYFIWNGGLYLTPGPGNACPSPSTFDGMNCYIMPMPEGSTPFKWSNNLYITPPPSCPVGTYTGGLCYIGTAPPSRRAFTWGSNFYYEH